MENFINTIKDEFSFSAFRDHIDTLLTFVGLSDLVDTIMRWVKFIIVYVIFVGLLSELFTCGINQVIRLFTPFISDDSYDIFKLILIIPKIYILIYLKNFRFDNNNENIFPDIFNSILNTIVPNNIIESLRPIFDVILYFPFYLGKSEEEISRLDNKLIPVRNEDYRYIILMVILSYIRF